MKKTIFNVAFLACAFSINAQTLYGTTTNGGSDGGGTINKLIPAAHNLTIIKSFEGFAANPNNSNLIQYSDGNLYGMTFNGGASGGGVIFSFDPSTSTYTKLKDFDKLNGYSPTGSLIQTNAGKFFGMTYSGGSNNTGVIFSFVPSSSTYIKLMDFDPNNVDNPSIGNVNGSYPNGSLVLASNGKLYGMTTQGGSSNAGVIFSFDPGTSTYTKLKDFNSTIGNSPDGSLVQANNGKLYGMTAQGGVANSGVLFSFDPSSSDYIKLKDLDGTTGDYPEGSLIQAVDGKLYGMTLGGGSNSLGVIFSFDLSTSNYKKVLDFDNTNGGNPYGTLVQASNGNLYGTTYGGGSNGLGVIFSFNPAVLTYTKLKDFANTDGTNPYGTLMQAVNGKLYGMTLEGGFNNFGVIFSLAPASNTYSKLRDFATNNSGSYPSGNLTYAKDGKLYGMTTSGGSSNNGVIYAFDPSSSTYKKLKDFDYINGANPNGSLIQASNGKLYGMTTYGGGAGYGVIFSFDPSSSVYTKLMDFDNTSGSYPFGSLMQASNGKLYGMASGGTFGYGVIFSFDPSSLIFSKLKDFNYIFETDTTSSNNEGAYPFGSLIEASNGKLYGMTSEGGSGDIVRGSGGDGIIFSFDPATSTYTHLKDFDVNGYSPYGSLLQASNGLLYGMTSEGGSSHQLGVIFSFDPATSGYERLRDFDTYGSNPYGSFMQASDGLLYGMTYYGGSSNLGVVFSHDAPGSVYTTLENYNGINGANPYYGSAFIEVPGNLIVREMCSKGNTDFVSNINGANYQWQLSMDSLAFNVINDNANFTGSHTNHLHVTNIPSSWYGYYFRCSVNGLFSKVYKLKIANHWTGSVSNAWENSANWSCGLVPDSFTDIILSPGMSFDPVLSSSNSCRSLLLNWAIALTITRGHTLTITGK